MLFSIFPLYLVVIKIALTVGFITIVMPLLCRWAFPNERLQTYDDTVCALPPPALPPQDESWLRAIIGVIPSLLGNLFYVVVRTVPLMLLAGFLGAVVANTVPLTNLVNMEMSLLLLIGVAVVGIFLPVPVAFDVVVVAVLITAGAPMAYSMTLLFTLGIFSIYPFFIVWTSISRRVAIVLTLVLIALGVCAGLIARPSIKPSYKK